MNDIVFLEGTTARGERVVLRPLSPTDIDACLRWRNDADLRLLIHQTYPVSEPALRERLDHLMKTWSHGENPVHIILIIVVDGQAVGYVDLTDISLVHRRATMGIAIGEKAYRGRQIGTTAWQLLIRYAFAELNLENLLAYVLDGNPPSIRLHKSCGFTLVGRIPRWFFKGGQWKDVLLYLLSRDGWLKGQVA